VGDSEAVLVSKVGDQPKGKKVAQIHKPEQASEANRIRALGGQVTLPTSLSYFFSLSLRLSFLLLEPSVCVGCRGCP
jgi:hypothetical protein